MLTNCLGVLHCEIAACLTLEEPILKLSAYSKMMNVLRAKEGLECTTWMYKPAHFWIGLTNSAGKSVTNDASQSSGRTCPRHRSCEEIQYQISGTRNIISQRGTMELMPGDFINIPLGLAFTEVCDGESTHVTVLSSNLTPAAAPIVERAKDTTAERIKYLCH